LARARWLVLALALLSAGCGSGGAAAGATVSVYVAAPLCAEARAELAKAGGKAGELEVRAVCLRAADANGTANLAAAGGDARRATEDSTAVAFLEVGGPAAPFSRSIVEAADIAWVETGAGAAAVRRVLEALDKAGSSSPRAAVLDEVG
jgi:hypothetical protein